MINNSRSTNFIWSIQFFFTSYIFSIWNVKFFAQIAQLGKFVQ